MKNVLVLVLVMAFASNAFAAFVNQKCERAAGSQQGPAEVRYIRVFYGAAPKLVPCRVEIERDLGGLPKPNLKKDDVYKAKNQASACDKFADTKIASLKKKDFVCVNE